jgi:hypothetical protein
MIKHAIMLYFILLVALITYKPQLFENQTVEFPCVIIILSVVSYFLVDFIK